jgi:hypothetical protein
MVGSVANRVISHARCPARERAVRWGLVPIPGASRLASVPGLGVEYEPAVAPDLVLYTDALDWWTAVEEVMRLVERFAGAARKARRPCA